MRLITKRFTLLLDAGGVPIEVAKELAKVKGGVFAWRSSCRILVRATTN